MPTRIAEWLTEHGRAAPQSRPEFVRSIIQSLAAAFSDAVRTASELSGIRVDVIHIVGGGSLNELPCPLTADLSGVPVLAGPVEATAIGKVLIQARAQGFVTGSLKGLRWLVASAFAPRRFEPARWGVHPLISSISRRITPAFCRERALRPRNCGLLVVRAKNLPEL